MPLVFDPEDYNQDLVFAWAVNRTHEIAPHIDYGPQPALNPADIPRDITIEELIASLGKPLVTPPVRFDAEGGVRLDAREYETANRMMNGLDWFWEHAGREARKWGIRQLGYMRD